MVRERSDQGDPRLRRRRWRLRQPLCGRHGLCAAPPLLGRGERQKGRLGPCHRRHGSDFAGDRARLRRAQRRHSHELRCERDPGREGPRNRRRHGQRRADRRKRGRLQPASRSSPSKNCSIRPLCPPTSAPASRSYRSGSGSFRMNLALSELPSFSALPGRASGRASRQRNRDRAEPRLYGARLFRRPPLRLVGRSRSSKC